MSTSESTTEPVTALQNTMREYVARGELPGLIYLVEHKGETVVEAIGDMDLDGSAMRRDTIVRISSMTKPITAAVTLILVEEGLFELDDPIDSVLPELRATRVLRSIESPLHDAVPANQPITVEDLLTFRMGSGIVLAMPGTYSIQRATDERCLGIGPPNPSVPPEPDEWIRRFAELPLIHQPGESWMYVTSSEVLGVFLARVTGTPLPDLLEDRIFSPLGMGDTGFYVPAEKAHRFATEYERDHETGEFTISDSPVDGQWSSPPAFPSGGGGLVSTLDDYASFARLLLGGGIYEGHRVLSENSIRLMTRNHLTDQQRDGGRLILGEGNGWGYGLAVRVSESDVPGRLGSYGWNGGLGTTWLNDPQADLIAILLTQMHWTSADYPASSLDFLRGAYRIADSEH